MTEIKELHDSGERRKFTSGAVRDRGGRKPRPDLISPHAQMREGMIMTLGAEKYKTRNWELGLPISECLASTQRHIEQYKRGDTDEDHIAQARWNLGVILHFEEEIKAGRMDPAIDDMPKYRQRACPVCGRGPVQPCQHPETGLEYTCSNCKWTSLDAQQYDRNRLMELAAKLIPIAANTAAEAANTSPDFYMACGASIPPRYGERTCSQCDQYCRLQKQVDNAVIHGPQTKEGVMFKGRFLEWDYQLTAIPTFYVTGPMRGLPFFNFPAFDGARDLGISLGYNVISPADLDRAAGIDPVNDPGCVERMKKENPDLLQDIVDRDICKILKLHPKNNDGLAILPDWQRSIGASAEIAVARFKGLRLVDARDFKTPIEV